MCTVTYFPKEDGFILTSNRDESPSRNAIGLKSLQSKRGESVYFPPDALKGGSWFAVSDGRRCGCILNGAYKPYDVAQTWPRSRGLMLLEMFDFGDPEDFAEYFPFDEVAPFTMLILEQGFFEEWKAGGAELHRRVIDPEAPHIWSSVTLYPEPVRRARTELYARFISENSDPKPPELIDFHSSQPFGDGTNDFIMNRGGKVQTVSITQFYQLEKNARILHRDLLSHKNYSQELST